MNEVTFCCKMYRIRYNKRRILRVIEKVRMDTKAEERERKSTVIEVGGRNGTSESVSVHVKVSVE